MAGTLGVVIMTAGNALVLTYLGYTPDIKVFVIHRSDLEVLDNCYRIAKISFWISSVSGLAIGLSLPKLVSIFRRRSLDQNP